MNERPDRLADIWSRFGQGTSSRLSGASVENTTRPGRADTPRYQPPGRALPDAVSGSAAAGTPDPVAEAAQALEAGIAARRGRRAAPPPPAPSAPEDLIAARLLADLKATEARVARRRTDYLAYAAAMQGKRPKRRKLLGLF